ncbi:MAG: bis(5'-nucleosyl)-tetraphosphatase (symmetrical) YqeK [bacterium]
MRDIEKELASLMTKERLFHIQEVKRIACEISSHYNVDKEKLELISYLHDIAKDIPKDEMKSLIEKYKIGLDRIEKREPGLWHGAIGACMAKERFNIEEEEILNAIKFHSTGMANMPLLSKILYIADYLETCPDGDLLDRAKRDIEGVLREVIKKKIEYVLKKGSLLHPRTVSLWNSICTQKA